MKSFPARNLNEPMLLALPVPGKKQVACRHGGKENVRSPWDLPVSPCRFPQLGVNSLAHSQGGNELTTFRQRPCQIEVSTHPFHTYYGLPNNTPTCSIQHMTQKKKKKKKEQFYPHMPTAPHCIHTVTALFPSLHGWHGDKELNKARLLRQLVDTVLDSLRDSRSTAGKHHNSRIHGRWCHAAPRCTPKQKLPLPPWCAANDRAARRRKWCSGRAEEGWQGGKAAARKKKKLSSPGCHQRSCVYDSSSSGFSESMNSTCVNGKCPTRPLSSPSHWPLMLVLVTVMMSPTSNFRAVLS